MKSKIAEIKNPNDGFINKLNTILKKINELEGRLEENIQTGTQRERNMDSTKTKHSVRKLRSIIKNLTHL